MGVAPMLAYRRQYPRQQPRLRAVLLGKLAVQPVIQPVVLGVLPVGSRSFPLSLLPFQRFGKPYFPLLQPTRDQVISILPISGSFKVAIEVIQRPLFHITL